MPGNNHFRVVCQHGVLITQCRCMGPKETRVEECHNSAHSSMVITYAEHIYVGKHRKAGTPNPSRIDVERPGTRLVGRHRSGDLSTGPV